MYDAIIIGSRVAGSATAMLLARKGYRVLAIDKATFPSDTLSTHQVQLPGVAKLKRWGLLDKIIATGAPATPRAKFDVGFAVLHGVYPHFDGVNAVYSPRRTHLDKILVDAAREAGAEVRENFVVEEVLKENGRLTGICGQIRGGTSITETASIIIGADGKHSSVAQAGQAPVYEQKPVLSCGYYSYFSGVPQDGGEMYGRERRLLGAWPTNDGLTLIYVAWPIAEFQKFRMDVEGNFMQTIALVPELAERVQAGRREERIFGTADMPNFYRKPYGPGWALVGDAGYIKDAITGQGISDAFRDAELLADALDAGFSGQQPFDLALADYERQRNTASRPMYHFTTELATFAPPSIEQKTLFAALPDKPQAISQFLGVLTGAVSIPEFFAPGNLFKIMGISGMGRILVHKLRPVRSHKAPTHVIYS